MVAGKRCATSRCPRILTDGSTRCPEHQAAADRARGTTAARGYGTEHRALRAKWAAIIKIRAVPCARCGNLIERGAPFDLGHSDDRQAYRGPEHPGCNRSAGAASASRPDPHS